MGTNSLVISTVLVSVALACSPEGYRLDIPLDEMASKSPIIALGTVIQTYPMSANNQSYFAELDVTCSYKGEPLPGVINITNAGSWPGICGYRNFTVGNEYFVFLDDLGGSYYQRYDQTKPMMSSLAEILTFCGLTVVYPMDPISNRSCVPSLKNKCRSLTEAPPSPPPSQGHPAPAPPRISHAKPPMFYPEGEIGSSGEMEAMTSTMEMYTNESIPVMNRNETAEVEVTTTEGTTLPVTGGSEGEDKGLTMRESIGVRTVASTVCLCVCTLLLAL